MNWIVSLINALGKALGTRRQEPEEDPLWIMEEQAWRDAFLRQAFGVSAQPNARDKAQDTRRKLGWPDDFAGDPYDS